MLFQYSSALVPGLPSPFLTPRCNNIGIGLVTMAGRVPNGSSAISSVCVDAKNKDQYRNMAAAATAKQQKRRKKIEEPSWVDLVKNSVVKVFFNCRENSKSRPWETLTAETCSGSGFAISGKKIITNAHVVEVLNEHALVRVKKRGSRIKYKAKVQKITHECDLAILEIDSEEFWEGMNPLELGDIPPLNEIVFVLGYPGGGNEVRVADGIISGVQTEKYLQSDTELMSIQIDAIIKPGNSGGPVLMESKVVGVHFESFVSKNIAVAIPTPVVKRFISGGEESDGQFAVFGSLDLSYQSMENAQIRNHYKMSPEMTGVLVNKINLTSGAHGILKKDDIILAVDGVPIGNDETIPFRNKERISFDYLVSMKKPGEMTLIKVLRKGQEHEYNISLKPVKSHGIVQQYYHLPSYYIFGGFVFVPLTESYCVLERITISEVLPDDINKGYDIFKDYEVEKVNGMKVKNLKHLCELIEECCTEELRLDLEDDKVVVLNYKSAKEATSQIMKRHKIKSAISKDLCLPLKLDDLFKDGRLDLLPWSVLPLLLDTTFKGIRLNAPLVQG